MSATDGQRGRGGIPLRGSLTDWQRTKRLEETSHMLVFSRRFSVEWRCIVTVNIGMAKQGTMGIRLLVVPFFRRRERNTKRDRNRTADSNEKPPKKKKGVYLDAPVPTRIFSENIKKGRKKPSRNPKNVSERTKG